MKTFIFLEPERGIEPPTQCLQNTCSAIELLRHIGIIKVGKAKMKPINEKTRLMSGFSWISGSTAAQGSDNSIPLCRLKNSLCYPPAKLQVRNLRMFLSKQSIQFLNMLSVEFNKSEHLEHSRKLIPDYSLFHIVSNPYWPDIQTQLQNDLVF